MSDFKNSLTVNGVLVSLEGHQHAYITTTTGQSYIEQTGAIYGASRLILANDNTLNGAIFQNDGLDLVDFIFSPSSRSNLNVRYEKRPTYVTDGNTRQFEIGPADAEWLTIGDNKTVLRSPSTDISGSSSIGGALTVGGSIVCVDGNSQEWSSCSNFVSNINSAIIYKTVNQTIPANANTRVNYDSVKLNTNDAWNTSTYRYTCLTDGVYSIIASVVLNSTEDGRLMVYKNGVEYSRIFYSSINMSQHSGVTDIPCLANDYLEIFIFLSTSRSVTNSLGSYVSFRRVQ